MVDALDEIRRVLIPGGTLIDLRPVLDRWAVEVAWSGGYQEVGRATDLAGPLEDDAAANAAMAQGAVQGSVREREESFDLFYYWDTAREMHEYIEEEWEDVIQVDDGLWASLASAWATANADARVRMRMKMLIGRYRNQKQ
jgi:hypothetical protein